MTIKLVSQLDTLPHNTDRTVVDWRRESQAAVNRALNIPTFRVHRNAVDQTIGTGSYTKIQFTHRAIDSHTYWDTTNYRFLPKVPGVYLFYLSLRWNYAPTTDTIGCRILKNVTPVADHVVYVDTVHTSTQVQALVEMNGITDYVEFYCSQDSGSSQALFGVDSHTYAQGFKVSD